MVRERAAWEECNVNLQCLITNAVKEVQAQNEINLDIEAELLQEKEKAAKLKKRNDTLSHKIDKVWQMI